MVISTNSDEWNESDEQAQSEREEIVEFLKENEDQAFYAREITDELKDTNWELAHEREQEIQRVGEDEFHERQREGEYSGKFERGVGEAVADARTLNRITVILDSLHDQGEIEVRLLPQDATDIPYEDFGEVPHFTYSGE
jgi:hypothetical protein